MARTTVMVSGGSKCSLVWLCPYVSYTSSSHPPVSRVLFENISSAGCGLHCDAYRHIPSHTAHSRSALELGNDKLVLDSRVQQSEPIRESVTLMIVKANCQTFLIASASAHGGARTAGLECWRVGTWGLGTLAEPTPAP